MAAARSFPSQRLLKTDEKESSRPKANPELLSIWLSCRVKHLEFERFLVSKKTSKRRTPLCITRQTAITTVPKNHFDHFLGPLHSSKARVS